MEMNFERISLERKKLIFVSFFSNWYYHWKKINTQLNNLSLCLTDIDYIKIDTSEKKGNFLNNEYLLRTTLSYALIFFAFAGSYQLELFLHSNS